MPYGADFFYTEKRNVVTSNKLNIPKTIHVGYQNRTDTYTGKLAYVVYTDDKGKLRKERSWNGWRDKKIKPDTYDNEPTSGFVLNKKVGDHNYGWNGRKAAIRIFDPRGFEFEIKVDNLLFILEECSAIKGKGLEGEFVYAWDRADHVLLPVTSQEYKASQEHTARQKRKVTKKDMVPGCLYLDKDGKEFMYLGRHEMHWLKAEWVWTQRRNGYSYWSTACKGKYIYSKQSAKHHVFWPTDGSNVDSDPDCRRQTKRYNYFYNREMPYWLQKGFTKLSDRVTEDADPRYPDEYQKFVKLFGTVPAVPPPSPEMEHRRTDDFSHKKHAKKAKKEAVTNG